MAIELICNNRKCGMTQMEDEVGDDGRCSYCGCDSLFEREVEWDELDGEYKPLIDIAKRNLQRLTELDS